MAAIEVFKTDIIEEENARQLHFTIQEKFSYLVNFDLSDCDRVMRVVSPVGPVDVASLTLLARQLNVSIVPLPDEVPA